MILFGLYHLQHIHPQESQSYYKMWTVNNKRNILLRSKVPDQELKCAISISVVANLPKHDTPNLCERGYTIDKF